MKRLLSLVLVLILLMSQVVGVKAAIPTEVFLNETYLDTPTNSLPENIETEGEGSILYVTERVGNKVLAVRSRWSDTSAKYKVSVTGGEVWIDLSSMYCDTNSEKNILEIVGAQSVPLIRQGAAGVIRDYQGNMLCTVQKNEWNRFVVKVNLDTFRYDIYVNNILRAERAIMPKITTFNSVGFTVYKNADAESVMYNNYIRVHRGEEPIKGTDVTAVKWNYEKETLDTTELVQPQEKKMLYYSETFEDVAQGARPDNITATSGTQAVKIDTDGNHYYNCGWDDGTLAVNFECPKIGIYESLPDQFVYEVDVRIGKNSNTVDLFSFRDGVTPHHFSKTASVNPNGNIVTYDGVQLGTVSCRNNWVTVSVISDFSTHKHDYYINGELALEGHNFQVMETVNSMSMFRTEQKISGVEAGGIQLDNIKIYSGDKLRDISEFQTLEPAIPEQVEIWEHEITPTSLSVDLKGYAEIPEYTSENPSAFLKDHHSAKGAFENTICLVANTNHLWLQNKKYSYPHEVKWEDEHFIAPADMLASFTSEQATLASNTVKIGTNFSAKIGEKKITVDGKEYQTAVAVQMIDDVVYIPAKEYTIYKLKKYYCETYKGLAVIADEQMDLNKNSNKARVISMLGYLVLDLPNTEAIQAAYDANSQTNTHPRINITDARMMEIIENAKNDTILAERLQYFRDLGETALTQESGSVEGLYVTYKMTGDKKYADKAEAIAVKLVNDTPMPTNDFNLNVAASMLSLSSVYDLFYNTLSKETKDSIADTIINKGLVWAKKMYYGGGSDWPNRKTNWNSVCNGGALIAATTLLGDGYDDALCLDMIEKGIMSLPNQLHAYAPYGSLFESIGYWSYGHSYLIDVVQMFENTFGTDFGIFEYPGFDTAGYFPVYLETHEDKWPLHDDNIRRGENNYYASWHAYKTHDLMLQKIRYKEIKDKSYTPNFKDLIYYIPEQMPEKIDIPLDINYSYSELATSRSAWENDAFFLGVHAGANDFEHFHYDLGNFIYEAFGVRFAQDIGRENYDLAPYMVNGPIRGMYYAARTEGHNLYVINPDESAGQLWHAASEIEVLQKKPKGIIYNVDMTPAYYGKLHEATRGYMLTGDRRVLVVQDEIVPNKVDDEYKWFWTTEADITIDDDRTITLKRKHKTVKLYFDSNVEFKLEKGVTEPLKTSPNPEGQLQYGNTANRITATFKSEAEKVYFRCIAVPYASEYEIGEIEPIAEWNIPDGDIYTGYNNANMIYVDGTPIKNFNPDVYDYTQFYIKHNGLPVVTVEASGTVKVTQAEDKHKTAIIKITSASGVERIYTISFQSDIASGVPDGTELVPVAIRAQDSEQTNIPENIIDNDFSTRWTGKTINHGWIELDLGSEKVVDAVAVAVFNGNSRMAFFDIQLSVDGEEYITVLEGGSTTGTSAEMEYVTFNPEKARYVRLVGHGASTSTYNSYTEFHAYKLN